MAKKKTQVSADVTPEVSEEIQTSSEKLQLFVGVNFTPEGKTEEVRIEPGLIDLGVLPAAFQTRLIEKKKARIRLN